MKLFDHLHLQALAKRIEMKGSLGLDAHVLSFKGHLSLFASEASLLTHLNQRALYIEAEIVFRPRCGLWRLRDFYELLVACRQQEGLAATAPSRAPAGGLRLPRSEEGWQAMLAAGLAKEKAFGKLSKEEKEAAAAEMRLCSACRGAFSKVIHI